MRSRRAIAVLLAGVILLGACSGWTDDERALIEGLCWDTLPDRWLEFEFVCPSLTGMLEDYGCTPADAAGAMADKETFADYPRIDWQSLFLKYPSCD